MVGLLGQRFKTGAQRFTGLLGRFIPPNTAGGLLSAEEAGDAQRQAQLATAASLLQASGPSQMPISFGQALGGGIMAGQAVQSGAMDSALTRRLLEAQIGNLQAPQEDRTITDLALLDALGLPRTEEGMARLSKARGSQGTTINIGEKMAEPIPINQLASVRLPDGSTPPIGTTFGEAREMGATVQSAAEQQRSTQADAALGILGELEDLAIGPDGVFASVEPGFINRAGAAVLHGIDMATQESGEVSRYHDMSRSTLAPFIKMLGESGALAEGDVSRALGLLPKTFPLPDTKEVATQKLKALREIIQRGVRTHNEQQSASELPPLPDGFTLDEEEGS